MAPTSNATAKKAKGGKRSTKKRPSSDSRRRPSMYAACRTATTATLTELNDNDIVCGRLGSYVTKLEGNLRFRRVAHPARQPYRLAPVQEKTHFVELVWNTIEKKGGRFLLWEEQDTETLEEVLASRRGHFLHLPYERAREKIAQTLREGKWLPPPNPYIYDPEAHEILPPSKANVAKINKQAKRRVSHTGATDPPRPVLPPLVTPAHTVAPAKKAAETASVPPEETLPEKSSNTDPHADLAKNLANEMDEHGRSPSPPAAATETRVKTSKSGRVIRARPVYTSEPPKVAAKPRARASAKLSTGQQLQATPASTAAKTKPTGKRWLEDYLDEDSTLLDLRETDVIFGRGSGVGMHPGNVRFREFVASNKSAYAALAVNKKKPYGLKLLEEENTSRFVEPDTAHPNKYRFVTKGRVIDKLLQALREKGWDVSNVKAQAANKRAAADMQDAEMRVKKPRLVSSKPKLAPKPAPSRVLKKGCRIAVFWPLDKEWYEAVVHSARSDGSDELHDIEYQLDGQREWINLAEHEWKLTKSETASSQPPQDHEYSAEGTATRTAERSSSPENNENVETENVLIVKKGTVQRRGGRRNLFTNIVFQSNIAAKVSDGDDNYSGEEEEGGATEADDEVVF